MQVRIVRYAQQKIRNVEGLNILLPRHNVHHWRYVYMIEICTIDMKELVQSFSIIAKEYFGPLVRTLHGNSHECMGIPVHAWEFPCNVRRVYHSNRTDGILVKFTSNN